MLNFRGCTRVLPYLKLSIKRHTQKTKKNISKIQGVVTMIEDGASYLISFIRFIRLANKPLEPTFAIFCKRPFAFANYPKTTRL